MSLFGSLLGDCDDDLFFGQHMRQMNSLMGSIMPDPFNMLTPFDNFGSNPMRSPTNGLFGFPGIPNLNRLFSGDMPDGNGASYCSSSVIQMTSGPDGRPQVYQATSSTKTGPGGVRETRKTVQDSRSGLKKMAIGHHIGERAHIIEREHNASSGEQEERQEFVNLEEEEAETFDREFTNKVRGNRAIEITSGHGTHRHYNHQNTHHRQLPALPAPPTSQAPSSAAKNTSTSSDTSETTTNTTTSTTNPTTSINSKITTDNKSTTSSSISSSLSSSSSAQRRQLLSSRNLTKISSRRPLRTPSSSPLASNTPSSTSVHPHPYNTSAVRRNYRIKNHNKNNNNHHSIGANNNQSPN